MSEFAESLHEVFERFGGITLRRMFGGHGVYHDGRMFGLVAGGRLYLKADEQSAPDFKARNLPPFQYERKGKLVQISIYEAPPEIFEDRDEASKWGRKAWEAVIRSGPQKARTTGTSIRAKPAKRKP